MAQPHSASDYTCQTAKRRQWQEFSFTQLRATQKEPWVVLSGWERKACSNQCCEERWKVPAGVPLIPFAWKWRCEVGKVPIPVIWQRVTVVHWSQRLLASSLFVYWFGASLYETSPTERLGI